MTATKVKVSIASKTGVFIANVPRRRAVKWQEELNVPGVGSMEIHIDDPILTAHPTLLDDFNIVTYSLNGTAIFSWIIEAKQRVMRAAGEGSDRWVSVSGRGVLALLNPVVVYPEYPLRWDTADMRSFDFGSKDGGWRVSSDWVTPLGIRQDSGSSLRKGYPRKWPDPAAQWLWSTNPNATSTAGHNYFRGSFTLTAPCRVTIYSAADDGFVLQLNGEPITSGNDWRTARANTRELPSGTHLLAADVVNRVNSAGGNNPAGFLCSVAKVDRNNKILSWLRRSSPSTFQVRGYGSPPGWFTASILKTLVAEAVARGVEGMSGVTFGFSDTVDTSGASWTGRQDRSFEIGTRDLLDIIAQLTEVDMDVAMSPTRVLNAWKTRGTDRRATVRLLPAKNVTHHESSSNVASVRGRALVRHGGGWIEVADSTSEAAYGRRETGIVVGSIGSDSQAQAQAQAGFNDTGKAAVTLSVTTTAEAGPQPYVDFFMADTVTTGGLLGPLAPARIMSISGEETAETIQFTFDLYPEP